MNTVPDPTVLSREDLNALIAHRRMIATDLLHKSRADLDTATRGRIRTAHLARAEGLSNEAIGQALGITEAGVRSLLQRNPMSDLTDEDR